MSIVRHNVNGQLRTGTSWDTIENHLLRNLKMPANFKELKQKILFLNQKIIDWCISSFIQNILNVAQQFCLALCENICHRLDRSLIVIQILTTVLFYFHFEKQIHCIYSKTKNVYAQVFPYNSRMEAYLKSTGRQEIANAANKYKHLLTPDSKAPYDEVIEHILLWPNMKMDNIEACLCPSLDISLNQFTP